MILLAITTSTGRATCGAACYNGHDTHCKCICGGMNHGVGRDQAICNTKAHYREWIERFRSMCDDVIDIEMPLYTASTAAPRKIARRVNRALLKRGSAAIVIDIVSELRWAFNKRRAKYKRLEWAVRLSNGGVLHVKDLQAVDDYFADPHVGIQLSMEAVS